MMRFWIPRVILEMASFRFVFSTPHKNFAILQLFFCIFTIVFAFFAIVLYSRSSEQRNSNHSRNNVRGGGKRSESRDDDKSGREKMLRQRSISKRKARMIQEVSNTDSPEMSHTNQTKRSNVFSSQTFKTKGHTSSSTCSTIKTQTERRSRENKKKRENVKNSSSSLSSSLNQSFSDCAANLEPVRFLRPELNFYSYTCSEKFTGTSFRGKFSPRRDGIGENAGSKLSLTTRRHFKRNRRSEPSPRLLELIELVFCSFFVDQKNKTDEFTFLFTN